MVPETSSRHSASRAITARAESLTALGAMPSAQLIVLSAVAFDDAVRDHFQNAMGHLDEKMAPTISERDRQAIGWKRRTANGETPKATRGHFLARLPLITNRPSPF